MAATRTLVTFADRLVLYVLVGTSLVLLLTGGSRSRGAAVRITGDDGFDHVAALGRDGTVEVAGPLGVTFVEIAGGEARVVSSPCRDQTCVKMGSVRTGGQTAVCVPNRVAVTVESDEPADTDATTR